MISVIVPIYNAVEDVKLCVASLEAYFDWAQGEVLLIDDGSGEETKKYLHTLAQRCPQFKVLFNQENLGFVKTCNRGMKLASGEIVVLLNSDTMIPANFTKSITSFFANHPTVGIASPISSCSISSVAARQGIQADDLVALNQWLHRQHVPTYPLMPAAEGFCFCVRAEVLAEIGELDEIYGKGYHEERDFSYRAVQSGWQVALIDDMCVYHKRHASFGEAQRKVQIEKNNPTFIERWGGFEYGWMAERNWSNPIDNICQDLLTPVYKQKIKKWLVAIYRCMSPSCRQRQDMMKLARQSYLRQQQIIGLLQAAQYRQERIMTAQLGQG